MYSRAMILFILIDILCVFAIPYRSNMLSKRGIYCGDKLTSTLRLVCKGNYYAKTMKRSGGNFLNFEDKLTNYLEDFDDDEVEYPLIPRSLAESLVPLKVRKGVVDECCYKSCTLDELSMYCAY